MGAGSKASRTWSSSLWTRGTNVNFISLSTIPIERNISQSFKQCLSYLQSVLGIRSVADPNPIFLGLLDPDPDPLVRGMDPDPYIFKQKW